MSKSSKWALIVGLAAGITSGVLFAPTKGKTFRDKVKKEIKGGGYGQESLWKHFKTMAQDVKDTTVDAYKDSALDEKVDAHIAKAKQKKDEVVATVKEKFVKDKE